MRTPRASGAVPGPNSTRRAPRSSAPAPLTTRSKSGSGVTRTGSNYATRAMAEN